MVIEVDPDRDMERLDALSWDLPPREAIQPYLIDEIFPLLDMGRWVDLLLSHLDAGHVASFSSIARALGEPRAARAVGELAASGALRGPTHRIIYADERVPDRSVIELGAEMELDERGGSYHIPGYLAPEDLKVGSPPFGPLRDIQTSMDHLLVEEPGKPTSLCGIDISSKDDLNVVCLSASDLNGDDIQQHCRQGPLPMPYVSGYLFYREGPLILPALDEAMKDGLIEEDTLLVLDGNGILHPRRSGIACQIGVAVDMMTCGVAKKLLVGKVKGPERERMGHAISEVRDGGDLLGYAVRTPRSKPAYLSRGNRMTLDRALEALLPSWHHKVPLPTRLAHERSNEVRRAISESPSGDLQVPPLVLHVAVNR